MNDPEVHLYKYLNLTLASVIISSKEFPILLKKPRCKKGPFQTLLFKRASNFVIGIYES